MCCMSSLARLLLAHPEGEYSTIPMSWKFASFRITFTQENIDGALIRLTKSVYENEKLSDNQICCPSESVEGKCV